MPGVYIPGGPRCHYTAGQSRHSAAPEIKRLPARSSSGEAPQKREGGRDSNVGNPRVYAAFRQIRLQIGHKNV